MEKGAQPEQLSHDRRARLSQILLIYFHKRQSAVIQQRLPVGDCSAWLPLLEVYTRDQWLVAAQYGIDLHLHRLVLTEGVTEFVTEWGRVK